MKKVLFRIAIVLLACVFLYSAYKLGSYIAESIRSRQYYDGLHSQVEQNRPTRPPLPGKTEPTGTVSDETTPPTEPVSSDFVAVTDPKTGEELWLLPEYAGLYLRNPDMVGWIEIPDTKISYPVMHTPTRPNYYLKRDFDGKWSERGCIYIREECDVFAPSDNVTIYGHHFQDGSMFSQIIDYKDRDFYESHKYIYFDTLTLRRTYEIVAVFETVATLNQGFPYYQFVDAEDEADFNDFMAGCKKNAIYEVDAEASYGDQLISLSTCDYDRHNGRMVIVAKRIA